MLGVERAGGLAVIVVEINAFVAKEIIMMEGTVDRRRAKVDAPTVTFEVAVDISLHLPDHGVVGEANRTSTTVVRSTRHSIYTEIPVKNDTVVGNKFSRCDNTTLRGVFRNFVIGDCIATPTFVDTKSIIGNQVVTGVTIII